VTSPLVSQIAVTGSSITGLSTEEVAERVQNNDVNDVPTAPSRTIGQILRANLLTPFNALLGGLFAVILVVGPIQDALFGLVLIANSSVGVIQELRASAHWIDLLC
jgi:cation-transporting ATPase E